MKETMKNQEAGISCKAMLELMGLPADAKKKLAVMLMDGEPDQAEDRDLKLVNELVNPMLELSLHIKRMKAVADCFANEYVDTLAGITCAQAIGAAHPYWLYTYTQELILWEKGETDQSFLQ